MRILNTLKAIAAGAAASALLAGCNSVPIWQPPFNIFNKPQPAPQPVPPPQGTPVPAPQPPEPVPTPPEPLPTPPEPLPTPPEQPPLPETKPLMRPGFIVTGEQATADAPVSLRFEALEEGGAELREKLRMLVPVPLLSRIGVEAEKGIVSLGQWLGQPRHAMKTDRPAAGAPTAELQVRVRPIQYPGQTPGVAVDIGNMTEPGSRDFIMAMRETDATFVEVEDGEKGTRMSLRDWLTDRAGTQFSVPATEPAPLTEGGPESWKAFTSVRQVGGKDLIGEEQAREMIESLGFVLKPSGLSGEGALVAAGAYQNVRRCTPSAEPGLPACARAGTALALSKFARAAGGNVAPRFAEVRSTTEVPGIGRVLMRAGNAMLTLDRGRVFFWKKDSGALAEVARIYGPSVLDTLQQEPNAAVRP